MILDANIVVYWLVDTPFYEAAIPFQKEPDLVAPYALNIEVISALQRYQKLDRFVHLELPEVPVLLQGLFSRFFSDENLLSHAIRISADTNHKIYDCLYLALARETADELITADKRLAKIARKLSISTTLIEPS